MVLSTNATIWCEDERRSGILRAPAHPLNGIDFVEYRRDPTALAGRQHVLDLVFLKAPPVVPPLVGANFKVMGGVRVVDIAVLDVEPDPGNALGFRVFVDREGDFSVYLLEVDHPLIDEERSQARFSFKAGCPTEFDCRQQPDCPPAVYIDPAINYLAKDYQSFRRLMVDFISERNPNWQERLPADLGMALVELFAYAGDYLSYYQDAGPGTESYLDTCLHRISAHRHARLVDYRMHDGRNAITFVHFRATDPSDGVVPAGAKLLTRVGTALVGEAAPPGPVVSGTADLDSDPALVSATVFETAAPTRVTNLHNELRIHTWADAQCCLAKGTVEAFLYRQAGAAGAETASAPQLQVGDYLLLEEVKSPVTGAEADADPLHRQVVRLTMVELHTDEAFTSSVPAGNLTPRTNPADPALPLLRVRWRREDALAFPLCLSAVTVDGQPIAPVAVARGNVAPADHGRTVQQDSADGAIGLPEDGGGRWLAHSLSLPLGPLTQQAMPESPSYTSDGVLMLGRHDLDRDVRAVAPAIVLLADFKGGGRELWTPVPDLLDSGPHDQQFVAEVDNAGAARLRFGDDLYGRKPLDAERVIARYRIGNGRAGNLGAGTLVHIVKPNPPDPLFADIAAVYQPLAAHSGIDPESVEEVRQLAPEAFRALQFRAVTERDWEEMAMRDARVAAAKATFRWTGSWYTVFVAIHPHDEKNLKRLPGGGAALDPDFAHAITAYLRTFKLAGYDLAVRAAIYVPLEIDVRICVQRGHLRGEVMAAAAARLSRRAFVDGTRGFFHPLEFLFGEPVYLSRLIAAASAVEGVESVSVTRFKRYWEVDRGELYRGLVETGPFEIARLDNDPNFPENGVLRLSAVGGL